jgi:hypothetical protein
MERQFQEERHPTDTPDVPVADPLLPSSFSRGTGILPVEDNRMDPSLETSAGEPLLADAANAISLIGMTNDALAPLAPGPFDPRSP